MKYLKTFLCILGIVCGQFAACEAQSAKPNILFILADDWGWGDLSCHGNKMVKTPNLDRLASESIEFRQFNVGGSVCSPSRVAFLTGHSPSRYCVYEAIGGAVKNREMQQVDWLTPKTVLLPRLLKNAGYVTGHFGKWHLSGPFDDAPLPAAYGVDEHAVWTGPRKANATEYDKVFDEAIGFLRKHRSERFYLNLWIHETHAPQKPTAESLQQWAHLDEQHRPYAAAVSDGDKGIGKVLAALKELNLESNTLVIFSSDNGPEVTGRETQKELRGGYGTYYSVGTTGGMNGRKRSLYEGGIHLPFFVRWPGQVPAGRLNQTTPLAAVDLLPTLCAAAGISLPEGYVPDGQNMLEAWKGAEPQRSKPLFWEWRGSETRPDYWPRAAVRDGQWKLLTDLQKRTELYRLPEDWAEASDLAKQHPDIVAKLFTQLNQWRDTLPKAPAPDCLSKQGRNKQGSADK